MSDRDYVERLAADARGPWQGADESFYFEVDGEEPVTQTSALGIFLNWILVITEERADYGEILELLRHFLTVDSSCRVKLLSQLLTVCEEADDESTLQLNRLVSMRTADDRGWRLLCHRLLHPDLNYAQLAEAVGYNHKQEVHRHLVRIRLRFPELKV